MSRKRIEEINALLNEYYESEDSFRQQDLAIELIQGHMVWLLEMTKQAMELEESK